MDRRILALALPALALFALAARKPDHPKHENHYAASNTPATDVAELGLNSAESQQEFIKVDAKFTNKTADQVLILKKAEAEFVLPQGTQKAKAPALFGGPLLILPNDSHGTEGHGAIQLSGTVSSLSWTIIGGEHWHGFTLGIPAQP